MELSFHNLQSETFNFIFDGLGDSTNGEQFILFSMDSKDSMTGKQELYSYWIQIFYKTETIPAINLFGGFRDSTTDE
jgi:hypothetical protein